VSSAGADQPGDGASVDVADAVDVRSAKKKKKLRTPWYLTLVVILGSLLVVVSGGSLALAYGLSNRYDGKAQHADILGDVPHNENVDIAKGPLNYLVLGTDSRDNAETEQADAKGDRSDTILLVHIAKGLGSGFVVSIPRDSYVDIPAGGSWKGGKNKINAAFSFGGANLAAKAIYNLTKVPLDGAVIINFAGVVNMVNAVGGVHVCVPYDVPNYFTDFPQYKDGWKKGCHDMAGEEAEVFMRQRHDVPGGDFGRIRSQQLVMQALAQKATSAGIITNPSKLDNLLVTVAQSLTIDKSMNLRDLAFSLKGIRPDQITFATAPYKGTMNTPAGSSVELDMAGCQQLFQAVLDDRTAEWLAAHPQPDVASYQGTGD
jgi:LCP family protein required for cell wall assembly